MPDIRKHMPAQLNSCEKCGYKNGFHVTLSPLKFTDRLLIKLQCPNCGQTYDVNWTVKMEP